MVHGFETFSFLSQKQLEKIELEYVYLIALVFQGCSYKVPSKLRSTNNDPNLEAFDFSKVEGPPVPDDLITAKLPDKHKFEAGFHLEMIHPVTFKSIDRYLFFLARSDGKTISGWYMINRSMAIGA